jgi:GNAT superfamily N-acetyltransferase
LGAIAQARPVVTSNVEVRRLSADEARAHAGDLAAVLLDCVRGGASVGFMDGFAEDDARAFYEDAAADVAAGGRILLAAFADERVVGTVQVVFARMPNQPHRADVAKLLVHREARGRRIGRLLMEQAEVEAAAAGRWLLVLDTASAAAEATYRGLGWQELGVVPDYALLPGGGFCDTVFFWKRLD